MKARVMRNKKGEAVASVLVGTEAPNLVPLDAEFEDEGDVGDMDLRSRELLDLDRLHARWAKSSKK